MYKKVMLPALVVGSLISFAVAGRAMPIDSPASVPNLVTKAGIICGPGMHLVGVVCVRNRPAVVVVVPHPRVCPPGFHLAPGTRVCVR
jgi:hypothetical protein